MANWIGYAVSVSCGEPLGCYQGTILEADGSTITLTKAFRNGFPYPKSQVTLNASDIKELKIIEARAQPSTQTHSTVAVTKNVKKGPRATVCENLQANPSSSGNQPNTSSINNGTKTAVQRTGPTTQMPRSKPIDIQGQRPNKNTNNTHSGSFGAVPGVGGGGSSTPGGRGGGGGGGGGWGGGGAGARRRNKACFSLAAADPELEQDFDFEKNLALFDKQALWDEMRNSQKPDLVRQTEGCGKFRHDENILGGGGGGAAARAIRVPPELRGHMEYVTDEGVVIPSVLGGVRALLWTRLARAGLAASAELLLARAAADVALRLVGGTRRLEPRNNHQVPAVVALLGAGRTGACGATTARLLSSHGVVTRVLRVSPASPPSGPLALALQQYCDAEGQGEGEGECGGERGAALARGVGELPTPDLVLVAADEEDEAEPEYALAMQWMSSCRAGFVRIEPGAGRSGVGGGGEEEAVARASVWAALPGEWRPALGRVYVANVAAPPALLAALGLRYRPPYGERAALPLHPREQD